MAFKDDLARVLGETKPVILAARLTEQGFETSEQTVGLWLRGVREPKVEIVKQIARALNVTASDLLGDVAEVA